VKFDIGEFYENLLRISKFGYNRTKMSSRLLEDLSMLFFLPATLNRHKSTVKLYQADSLIPFHSVCLSVVAPTGQVSMKTDIGNFYKNLWRNSKFD
jgi:hypothetical protein